jgi:hypothetical protein
MEASSALDLLSDFDFTVHLDTNSTTFACFLYDTLFLIIDTLRGIADAGQAKNSCNRRTILYAAKLCGKVLLTDKAVALACPA